MGLGAGDGDGLGIHRHREDGVALGERVGHQWHYRRHVDFQWVDAQIRLPGPLGEPFGQGFQAQALGCDALNGCRVLLAGSADKRWAISGVISRPSTKAGNS